VNRRLVFDTSCISHFARAGRLDVLERIADGRECVIPNEVATEIESGVDKFPALRSVASQLWLRIVELDFPETISAVEYKHQLGGGPRQHLGESAVLAYVKQFGGTAIIDDSAAVEIARLEGIPVRQTLGLVIHAYRSSILDRPTAETVVDQLVATEMRLPVDGRGLFAWAYENELL
jgi:predicted nucleic acid-binding protein